MMHDDPIWDAIMWIPLLLVVIGVPVVLFRMTLRLIPVAIVVYWVALSLHWHERHADRRP